MFSQLLTNLRFAKIYTPMFDSALPLHTFPLLWLQKVLGRWGDFVLLPFFISEMCDKCFFINFICVSLMLIFLDASKIAEKSAESNRFHSLCILRTKVWYIAWFSSTTVLVLCRVMLHSFVFAVVVLYILYRTKHTIIE